MSGRGQFFAFWLVVLGAVASFGFASDAMAQANLQDASGSYTGLLDLVRNSASQWDGRLRNYAVRLFWLLAAIQFIWTFFPLVFRQADFGEIVGELLRFIVVIGFFFALLLYSSEWAEAIVNSFRQAGASAAGLGDTAMRPGDMFGTAVELADTIGEAETWNPLSATLIALAGVVVLLCFAFIAAFMGLTIIESYVVINASVLFMGLGASQWTREFAVAILRYALSVGAKLFVLTLLVGLVITSAKEWQAAYNHDDASMWTMVGLALVCAYLSKTIPELIQGMISGGSMGGGATLGTMAAAVAAGAAAAAATVATAGAAGPAAGAAGAGAGGAGAAGGAAGGSGLAGLINSSFAGQSAAPVAGSTASAGGGLASSATSGTSNAAKAVTPRIGGGDASSGGPAPKASAAKAANQSQQKGDDQGQGAAQPAPAASDDQSGSGVGRTVASGLVRGSGILSAISVPGMEGAAGLSLGVAPPAPSTGEGGENGPSMEVEGSENIIRPAGTASVPPAEPTPSAGVKPQAGPAPEAPQGDDKP